MNRAKWSAVGSKSSSGGGTVVYVLGSLIEGVVAMAFTMALVRLISTEDFGAWRQFMVLGNIAWNITIFGLPRSLIYFYSIGKGDEQGAIARRSLWLCLGFGAVAAVVFYFGLGFAADRFDSPALAEEAFLFSSFLLLSFPAYIFNPLLLAANRRTLLAGTKIALALLRLSALVALVWFAADLRTLLLAMNVFAVVQFVVLVVIYLRVAGPAMVPLSRDMGAQLGYSANLTGQTIAGQVAVETDKLIVSAAYPPAEFAAYSVGARELPLMPMIPFSISDSISPHLSRLGAAEDYTEFRELWHKWIRRTALLIYPVFAMVLFQAKEIVTILYTADYLAGAIPLLIIGCLIPMRVTSFYQVLLTLNGAREIMYASFAMLGLIAGLGYLFLNIFGMWGPAVGVVIAEYVVNAAVLMRIARRTRERFAKILPWGFLAKLLAITVASGAAALPVLELIGSANAVTRFAVFCAVLLVLYGALAMTFRMVSQEDLVMVRNRLKRKG
ncbi:MAG: oligosaccharide flippase family protein [bacterium]|nr:oligosaccharide flippase family protein [bacterium]